MDGRSAVDRLGPCWSVRTLPLALEEVLRAWATVQRPIPARPSLTDPRRLEVYLAAAPIGASSCFVGSFTSMSKPTIVDIPHQLGANEARRRIEQGFAKFAAEVGGSAVAQVRHDWIGDQMTFSFGALGQFISGIVHVRDASVRLEVTLPGILGVMADALRGRVEKQGRLLLGRK